MLLLHDVDTVPASVVSTLPPPPSDKTCCLVVYLFGQGGVGWVERESSTTSITVMGLFIHSFQTGRTGSGWGVIVLTVGREGGREGCLKTKSCIT